jgi:hypothetical protein
MIQFGLPRWAPPIVALVVLLGLFPQVRQWDKERKVEVAISDMKIGHELENKTDSGADEVGLLEIKINDLLNYGTEKVELSRSGNIHYTAEIEGTQYDAKFFISAIDYSIHGLSITGVCKGSDCVTITKSGTFSDESIQTGQITIPLQSNEQGNKLIEILQQYEAICNEDTKIERGWKRKIKKLFEGFM